MLTRMMQQHSPSGACKVWGSNEGIMIFTIGREYRETILRSHPPIMIMTMMIIILMGRFKDNTDTERVVGGESMLHLTPAWPDTSRGRRVSGIYRPVREIMIVATKRDEISAAD